VIRYPFHPRAGERVAVVRRLQHGDEAHFVIDQRDGSRTLLPAWMTEAWATQIATVEIPRLTLMALCTVRDVINGALLSLSPSPTIGETWDHGSVNRLPAARSVGARDERARARSGPPPLRMEVTLLLTRLMTEYLAAVAAQPAEAADE
jgi:hypothetical protein